MNKNYLLKCLVLASSIMVITNALAVNRIIIKYKSSAPTNGFSRSSSLHKMRPLSVNTLSHISSLAGTQVKEVGTVGVDGYVLQLNQAISSGKFKQLVKNIEAQPDVQYVEEDKLMHAMTIVPNTLQWDMFATSPAQDGSSSTWYGDNFTTAWASLAGLGLNPGHGVVVAVVDTGYTPNQSILPNLEPYTASSCTSASGLNTCYGYQFITDCNLTGTCSTSTTASPQPDALDTGTYVTSAEAQSDEFAGCPTTSDWHGTNVSGIIAGIGSASSSPNYVAGGAFAATILPVRVLGKCGIGNEADIANGIYWAVNQLAGYTNPNPAQIINLSLGETASCSQTLQSAITTAVNSGAVVVVAAGNEDNDSIPNVSTQSPANCVGVISVSAKDPTNSLAWYSAYGATTITASGGGGNVGSNSNVYSSLWSSYQQYQESSAGGTSTYGYEEGTSMATPHVSAVLADLISYFNTEGYSWSTSTLVNILQSTSSTLANSCNTGGGCVSGKTLDAGAAINNAISSYKAVLTTGTTTTLSTTARTATLTFTNTGTSSTSVTNWQATAGPSLSLSAPSSGTVCIGNTIAPGQTCQEIVTLTATGLFSTTLLSVELLNGNSVVVGHASISATYVSPTPKPSSGGGGGGGGGCAMVQSGNDSSLLISLSVLALIYLGRKWYCRPKTKQ